MSNYERVKELFIKNPDITIREIVKELGIGHGTVVHHLNRLPEYKAKRSRKYKVLNDLIVSCADVRQEYINKNDLLFDLAGCIQSYVYEFHKKDLKNV